MSHSANLEARLRAAFAPERLEIVNESHLHAGHHHGAGHDAEAFDGGGETHLRVRIAASAFAGLSRVAIHRAVNEVAAPELAAGLHALAIEAGTSLPERRPAAPADRS